LLVILNFYFYGCNLLSALFLLESHRGTTFEDLKAGLAFLKRKVDGENESQLSFIKANVNSIVDQLVSDFRQNILSTKKLKH
jgi:Exocyst complex component Sec5